MLDYLIYLNQWVWTIIGLLFGLPIVMMFVIGALTSLVVLIYSFIQGVFK